MGHGVAVHVIGLPDNMEVHTVVDESLEIAGTGHYIAEVCKVERVVDSETYESIGLREGCTYWVCCSKLCSRVITKRP
jgi:hypothetical protein